MGKTEKIYVCYHSECIDGFTGAWIMWKKFKNRAEYIALNPDTIPTKKIKNSLIYFVDLCPRGEKINFLKKQGNVVIVIDHHVSSKDFVKNASDYLFDTRHSGSMLAWKYMNPKSKIPLLVRYVEDIDLWKFSLPKTRHILSFLSGVDRSFNAFDKTSIKLENPKYRRKIYEVGSIITKHEELLINDILANKIPAIFEGKKAFVVNSPIFNSHIGSEISKKYNCVGIIWYQTDDGIRVSLRSKGLVDVSKMAKKYGGGGHKNSAGFTITSLEKLPWREIK